MIQIGGVYTTFCQEEGILLQKYRDRNGRCIAILFKGIGVRGRFDSPDNCGCPKFLAGRVSGKFQHCCKKNRGAILTKVWALSGKDNGADSLLELFFFGKS